MTMIFQAPAIVPGEPCLVAERTTWEALVTPLGVGSVGSVAIATALRDTTEHMVRVSLPPEQAAVVLAAVRRMESSASESAVPGTN